MKPTNHTILVRYHDYKDEDKAELIQVPFIPIPGDGIVLNSIEYNVSSRLFDIDENRTTFFLLKV